MAEAARLGGDHLVCRAGCAECCIGPFPINHLDARRLRRGIREIRNIDPDRVERVVQRARETALLFAPEFPGDPSTGLLADDEGADEALAERFAEVPCPALDPDQGICEVYEYRPIPCRTYGPPGANRGQQCGAVPALFHRGCRGCSRSGPRHAGTAGLRGTAGGRARARANRDRLRACLHARRLKIYLSSGGMRTIIDSCQLQQR
jgi:Fe-S-cluster containining protein